MLSHVYVRFIFDVGNAEESPESFNLKCFIRLCYQSPPIAEDGCCEFDMEAEVSALPEVFSLDIADMATSILVLISFVEELSLPKVHVDITNADKEWIVAI